MKEESFKSSYSPVAPLEAKGDKVVYFCSSVIALAQFPLMSTRLMPLPLEHIPELIQDYMLPVC